MTKTYATNISWDTDDETIDLPTKVLIPNDIQEASLEDDTAIADYLSDEYGWCVNSLEIIEN